MTNNQSKIKKVLMIDDDKAMVELYQTAFSLRKEYQLIAAFTSQEGEKLAKQEKPDLILLDLVFPKEEGLLDEMGRPIKIRTHAGYQLLKTLKQDPQTKNIPVVVLTNLPDKHEDEAKARMLGANDYLVKAKFLPRELIEKIDEILKE